MTTALLTTAGRIVQCRSGAVYTADAYGNIASAASGDVLDLLNAGCYLSQDPPGVTTQFGLGGGTFNEEGNLYRFVSGITNNPASTAADIVMAAYTLPANSFDTLGRGLVFNSMGTFANNTNSKRAKIIVGATTAVVGSAVTGGTTLADTLAYTTAGAVGWSLAAQVFKYGASGSNTQNGVCTGIILGSTHGGMTAPVALTLAENAPITVAFTLNCATATTDGSCSFVEVNALN